MLNKNTKTIIIVLIVIQFLSLIFLALNNALYTWDEASYVINGLDLADQLAPSLQVHVDHERHPLLSWIIAGATLLHLPSLVYQLLGVLSLALFFLLAYLIGTKFYGREVGLIAGLILISIPTVVFLSTKILTDLPGAVLFSGCLYCYYLGLEKPKYFLWGGLLGGLSILMRDMNLLLIPILAVFSLVFWKKINQKFYWLSLPIALTAVLPYFLDNYFRWGNPLFRILRHLEMVQQGIGYQTFSLQSWSLLWLFFLPLLVGLPIFIFFVIHLYHHRKQLRTDLKLQFLLIWFLVPFLIFLLGQKLTPRLMPVFVVPILLLGTKELIARKKAAWWLILILLVNLFLIWNVFVYSQIALTSSQQQLFDFIPTVVPSNETIYTNFSPPSVVALYTLRSTAFVLHPDQNSSVNYYLYDLTYERYLQRTKLDPSKYQLLFNNSRYLVYTQVPTVSALYISKKY